MWEMEVGRVCVLDELDTDDGGRGRGAVRVETGGYLGHVHCGGHQSRGSLKVQRMEPDSSAVVAGRE